MSLGDERAAAHPGKPFDSFEKEYIHHGLTMIWIPQKKAKLRIQIVPKKSFYNDDGEKIEWNSICLVQMPNPTQMQKLFEIL